MNSILLDLGFIKIYWYSFFILIAALLGCYLAIKESKKRGIPENFMINYIFYLIPLGIIGARLYYVIFNFNAYQNNLIDILKIWEGGLAIHGGIIVGLIWTYYYTKKYKINFLKITDIASVSIIICQAIGRWGNFFNSEAYGSSTTLEFLKSIHIPNFIIDGMYINGSYYQPTFFYESIWCVIGFIFLLLIRKNKSLIIGHLTSFYLIWYGIGRFLIESLRMDSLMFGSLKVAQIISIIMIIFGILIIILTTCIKKFKHNYKEKQNAIIY